LARVWVGWMVRVCPPLDPLPLAGGEAHLAEDSSLRRALQAPLPQAGGAGGGPFRKRALNNCNNALQITKNVVVPEADYPPALGVEIAGPGSVVSGAFVMLATIDFNDQFFRSGGEIGNVGADRHLPVEADACDLASRQGSPQPSFRIGRVEAEFACPPCRAAFAEGPGALPSVPSRLREGMRSWRRDSLSNRRNGLPSRRREGLGEGTTLTIRTIHQPHSPTYIMPTPPSPARSPCSYPAPPHGAPSARPSPAPCPSCPTRRSPP